MLYEQVEKKEEEAYGGGYNSNLEYEDGQQTGRTIEIKISYIWEDWTGLDDDYCIIGFKVKAVRK